jgi:DNA-3-methyladenine glycosylase II
MVELGRLMGLDAKPSEKQLRELAEAWRPYRGAAAVLAWHSYNSDGAPIENKRESSDLAD